MPDNAASLLPTIQYWRSDHHVSCTCTILTTPLQFCLYSLVQSISFFAMKHISSVDSNWSSVHIHLFSLLTLLVKNEIINWFVFVYCCYFQVNSVFFCRETYIRSVFVCGGGAQLSFEHVHTFPTERFF